jgi:hypothetical protein
MYGTVDKLFDGAFRLEDVEVVVADVAGVVQIWVWLGTCMQTLTVDRGALPHSSFDVCFFPILLVTDIVCSDQVFPIPDEDWVVVRLAKAIASLVRARVVGVSPRW